MDTSKKTKEINGVIHYECRGCQTFKPKEEYHPSKTHKLGIQSLCKICNNIKHKATILISDSQDEHTAKGAREILEGLGYDLDKNVHEQFKERIFTKYGTYLK